MITDLTTISTGLQKIDDADYHRLPFASKHALDVIFERSPLHLKYERENPTEPTEAMRFGSALHTFVLEPEAFAERHPVATTCTAITGKGQPCQNPGNLMVGSEWRCGTHGKGGEFVADAITAEDSQRINAMHAAIMNCRPARELLIAEGENEQAAIWDRDVQGDGWTQRVRCKLKADMIRPSWDAIVDIKSCASAAPAEVQKSLGSFGYFRQGAYYLDGLAAVGVNLSNFILIFVEKEPPHAVGVYSIKGDAIELGRAQNDRLLLTYANCERTGVWSGFDREFRDVTVPHWLIQRERSEL